MSASFPYLRMRRGRSSPADARDARREPAAPERFHLAVVHLRRPGLRGADRLASRRVAAGASTGSPPRRARPPISASRASPCSPIRPRSSAPRTRGSAQRGQPDLPRDQGDQGRGAGGPRPHRCRPRPLHRPRPRRARRRGRQRHQRRHGGGAGRPGAGPGARPARTSSRHRT